MLLPPIAVLVLIEGGCTTDRSSDGTGIGPQTSAFGTDDGVNAATGFPSASLDCSSVIDVLDAPPASYSVVLDVVAFDGSDNSPHSLQAVENEQTGWFGAKTGLLVRSGSSLSLSVPPAMRDRMQIGWGGSGGTWELTIPGCERPEEWLVFSGGLGVKAPECVPLIVHSGGAEQRVMIGVGAPCPRQHPTTTALSRTTEPAAAGDCRPALTEKAPLIGPEARAESGDDIEVWALIFNSWNLRNGDPVQIPARQEAKIVWRITGDGELLIDAIGPDGTVVAPDWGPEDHGSSNWNRPGDEWGTGWTFPRAGCWTFRIVRGSSTAILDVDVFE